MRRLVTIYVCSGASEERWLQDLCEREQAEHELELDLDIERALGPWPSMDGDFEEADIEYVPIEALEDSHE